MRNISRLLDPFSSWSIVAGDFLLNPNKRSFNMFNYFSVQGEGVPEQGRRSTGREERREE